jgi:hydroxymethylglutaryl-CoA lyase
MRERVWLREVGPRDGLQLVSAFLPTERKIEWISLAAQAGVSEIEITSFVPARVVPQFADAAEVAAASTDGAFLASALAVNAKGAFRAFDAGLRKVNYIVSASEAHSRANARQSREEALAGFGRIVAERDARGLKGAVTLSAGVATAFGCSLQGAVAEGAVIDSAARLAEMGAEEILIADTVGHGDPRGVARIFREVAAVVGDRPLTAHFHDTRGLGLANVAAALQAGVRRFDGCVAGLGGCPFAPGASGNVNLEDTAFMLESMGFDTGVDIDRLIALSRKIEGWLPGEAIAGALRRAGLPRGWRPHD